MKKNIPAWLFVTVSTLVVLAACVSPEQSAPSESAAQPQEAASDTQNIKDITHFTATFEQMLHAAQNPDAWVILDARTEAEFAGAHEGAAAETYGTGRIAGAIHIEWSRAFNDDGSLLPEAELRVLFADILDGRSIITYCRSGARSARLWSALSSIAVGTDVWNYEGSWIEWSRAASSAGAFADRDLVLSLTEAWTDNTEPFS